MIIYATFSDKRNQMRKYYSDKKRSKSTIKQRFFLKYMKLKVFQFLKLSDR